MTYDLNYRQQLYYMDLKDFKVFGNRDKALIFSREMVRIGYICRLTNLWLMGKSWATLVEYVIGLH